jgi:hypothetical protein
MAYNLLFPVKIVDAGSMGANITSAITEIRNQDNVGIQLNWTGTPVGTFSVQVSIDHAQDANGNVTVPGSWTSLALNPAITAAGGPDTAYIDLNQMSASYIRVVYARTSGSGTLNAFITAKGV